MDRIHLTFLQEWFEGFSSSFCLPDTQDQKNIALKVAHTCKVRANIRRIAGEESLDEGRTALAEAIALFHDVGRFPQFCRYKTFRDSDSVNHARLGANILIDWGVLDKLPRNEQDIIATGVRYHNSFAIPPELGPEAAFFLKLVRDADKLDIWRVFLDFYRLPEEERASAVGLGCPDMPECSLQILTAVCQGELAKLEWAKSLNDFKLLQLSWVYDLNFAASFRMLEERDYINGLAQTLPHHEDILRAVAAVRRFALSKREPTTNTTEEK